MTAIRYLASTALVTVAFALGSVGPGSAQSPAPADHTAHHPAAETSPPPAGAKRMPPSARSMPAAAGAPDNGMTTGGNMPQMAQMMRRMMLMHEGMAPAGMMPFGHIEGQIAFYKEELHVTDTQLPQWTAFADAMRGNAAILQAAMQKGMQTAAAAAPQQMERRITMLTIQLDTMKAMLAAATPLYEVLSDDQKKAADEFMAEHLMRMRGTP